MCQIPYSQKQSLNKVKIAVVLRLRISCQYRKFITNKEKECKA
jgi:hypothetical protein